MRHFAVSLCALCASSFDFAACSRPGPLLTSGNPEPAMPTDHPPLPPDPQALVSAGARRLSVQHLRLSYPAVLGDDENGKPITWRLGDGSAGLDKLARPMGEPDYIFTSDEVLEPSPLYVKFIDDAARSVCDQATRADATRANAKRVLTRHAGDVDTLASNPKAVNKNLRYLVLRVHGLKIADQDDASVAPLAKLFDDAVKGAAGKNPVTRLYVNEGWRAVCVALFTAPEFHTY